MRVLANRYRLERHLGRGATGDVYEARHQKVPRSFAVKVLLPELVSDPKVVARFEREAELAGRLRHRNVTSVIDVGETEGTRFLVMDFAEGVDLGTLIGEGVLDQDRALRLFRQIVEGLEHAHEHGVVHRDLKPENVIVERCGDDEVARIVDFGVAILRDSAGSHEGRLTTGGLVIGTPHYMSPELATGKAFDHRIDLFALGVILYELLTGAMPFDGTGVEVALKNLKVEVPPMKLRAPGVRVDPLLEALTRTLMAKRPDDRPASARAVRELLDLISTDREAAASALGIALAAIPTHIPDSPTTRELLAVANQRSRWVARIATAALLLAVTAVGVTLLGRHPAAAAVDLEMSAPVTVGPTEDYATARETVPAPSADEQASVMPSPVGPKPTVVITTPAPKQTIEASPVDPSTIVEKYQRVARQLKQIADRRDMAADDLWQRYRRIRIQDALASSAKRADAMNELTRIESELAKRFGARP